MPEQAHTSEPRATLKILLLHGTLFAVGFGVFWGLVFGLGPYRLVILALTGGLAGGLGGAIGGGWSGQALRGVGKGAGMGILLGLSLGATMLRQEPSPLTVAVLSLAVSTFAGGVFWPWGFLRTEGQARAGRDGEP